jgi:hypothetical protein
METTPTRSSTYGQYFSGSTPESTRRYRISKRKLFSESIEQKEDFDLKNLEEDIIQTSVNKKTKDLPFNIFPNLEEYLNQQKLTEEIEDNVDQDLLQPLYSGFLFIYL